MRPEEARDDGDAEGSELVVRGVFFEVNELAARLAVTAAGAEEMVVEASARNLVGHHLYLDSPAGAPLSQAYVTHVDAFGDPVQVSREDLVAHMDDLVVDAASALLQRFGFAPSREVLRSVRDEFH